MNERESSPCAESLAVSLILAVRSIALIHSAIHWYRKRVLCDSKGKSVGMNARSGSLPYATLHTVGVSYRLRHAFIIWRIGNLGRM